MANRDRLLITATCTVGNGRFLAATWRQQTSHKRLLLRFVYQCIVHRILRILSLNCKQMKVTMFVKTAMPYFKLWTHEQTFVNVKLTPPWIMAKRKWHLTFSASVVPRLYLDYISPWHQSLHNPGKWHIKFGIWSLLPPFNRLSYAYTHKKSPTRTRYSQWRALQTTLVPADKLSLPVALTHAALRCGRSRWRRELVHSLQQLEHWVCGFECHFGHGECWSKLAVCLSVRKAIVFSCLVCVVSRA